MYLFNFLFTKKGYKFILYHLIATLIFAVLYYIQDYFITNNFELAKKIYLVEENYKQPENDSVNSFIYYLWFSLITQTTVGYSWILNEKTGQSIPFSQIHERTYKIINIAQLLSIFYITAHLM